MSSLSRESCSSCGVDAQPLTERELVEGLRQLPGWQLHDQAQVPRLVCSFEFADFAQALAFTQVVAAIAEAEGHHPALLTEWGRVTVSWWTHRLKGLHRNDLVMAAKTQALYRGAALAANVGVD